MSGYDMPGPSRSVPYARQPGNSEPAKAYTQAFTLGCLSPLGLLTAIACVREMTGRADDPNAAMAISDWACVVGYVALIAFLGTRPACKGFLQGALLVVLVIPLGFLTLCGIGMLGLGGLVWLGSR